MNEAIVIEAYHTYGEGTIFFKSGFFCNCKFKLIVRNDCNYSFQCCLYLDNINLKDVLKIQSADNELNQASFQGRTATKGDISIKDITLTKIHFSSPYLGNEYDFEKYMLEYNKLKELFLAINKETHELNLSNIVYFTNRNFIVIFEFLINTEIQINYDYPNNNEFITSKWSLTNFRFGPDVDDILKPFPFLCSFNIKTDLINFEFQRKYEYYEIIKQCSQNHINSVTCNVKVVALKKNLFFVKQKLDKICMILSFANGNWIVPVFNDTFKNKKLIQTIINVNQKVGYYPYIHSQYLIDISLQNNDLNDFVNKSLNKYDALLVDFNIHKVIEYCISSISSHISQQKFTLGYFALECLCSKVKEYAEKNKDLLLPSAIKDTKTKLEKVCKNLKINIADEQLEIISNEVAYKQISIKDAQRYILKKFNVFYDNKNLNELYLIRNNLFHGNDYDFYVLSKKIFELYDLLDRIILTMFDWKHRTYISKINGYKKNILK